MPVTITFPTTTAHQFALVVQNARAPSAVPPPPAAFPPVSIADIAIPGLAPAPADPTLATGCVGTVRIDGHAVRYRLEGDAADARRGLRDRAV